MRNVTQAGASGDTPRVRTFSYDSLSRLTSSSNPESGTTTYSYDANGNLQTKISPAPNTEPGTGQTVTTSYTYDALNRLILKQAAGINYAYIFDVSQSTSTTGQNQIGRLAEESNDINAGAMFGYDPMGRLITQNDCIPSECGVGPTRMFSAKYDLAGNMTDLTYPDGRHITQAHNDAGQLSNIVYADWNGQSVNYPYASAFSYTPSGAIASMTLGNGVQSSNTFNSRLQICQTSASFPSTYGSSTQQTAIQKSYYYGSSSGVCAATSGNNGNITSIADIKNPGKTEGFAYDSLNRLSYASRSDGAFNFSYAIDSFGNMQQVNNLTGNPGVTFLSNNQMQMGGNGYTYDAAGNLIDTGDPMYGGHRFTFNAENQVTQLDQGSTATYTYDATGQRVRKDTSSDWTEYLYFAGRPLAEKHSDGSWSDHIFAGDRRIARADSYDVRIHFTGTNCSSCGNQAWAYTIPVPALTIQAGDKIAWRQYQSGPAVPRGGLSLQFSDGANTNWQTVDQDGQTMNDDATQSSWHYRVVDLSQYVGKTISMGWINEDTNSGAGHWEEWFSDISLFRQDGTVRTIFNRLNSVSYTSFGSSGVTNQTFEINRSDSAADAQYPRGTTTYYVTDHLGTAQMEFTGGGWPVWQGEFAPYGQEINSQATVNHYKFTGKERDTESGLDYFGARYYGSSMGRFMSPDPSGLTYADITNPQSLNLYSYALNNPLKFIDPTGMYCFYGGKGDTVENDSDPSDYDFMSEGTGECSSTGGQWIDNPSTTVTVSAGGDNGNTLSTFPSDISQNYQFIPGHGCSAALKTAGANSTAINNYYNRYQAPINNAANAHGVDPHLLAGVGIRESGLPANPDVVQPDGQGRGLFQIDFGAHAGVTLAQAFDPSFSANYAANMLSTNMATLASQHPNLNAAQLTQATAASYNFGTGNISGNPNTIDVGTTGGNYGSNVVAISVNCF
jgi:RHS repeat-associated protein